MSSFHFLFNSEGMQVCQTCISNIKQSLESQHFLGGRERCLIRCKDTMHLATSVLKSLLINYCSSFLLQFMKLLLNAGL